MYKRGPTTNNKRLYYLGIVVVLAVAVGLYLHFHNKNPNLAISHSNQPAQGTTSKPAPHKVPTTSTQNPTQSGGVVDKNGQASGSLPPASQWVSSSSGKITLQEPSPNGVIKSGDDLIGLAQVSTVQFVLKDDAAGQIAQGNLNVINGKFSGVLQFTPHASSGKLEVYYPNPGNGAEEDIVVINVNFNVQ